MHTGQRARGQNRVEVAVQPHIQDADLVFVLQSTARYSSAKGS